MQGKVFKNIESFQIKATKKEKILIQNLYNIPIKEIIYLSITELAERTGVAEATIVRVCYKLGYKGYQDFKLNLSQDVTENVDFNTTNQSNAYQDFINVIRNTHESNSLESLELIAKQIVGCNRVCIFALGNSIPSAIVLYNFLAKIGCNVQHSSDTHMQYILSANLTKKDVALFISTSGSTKEIIEMAKITKERGCKNIAITSKFKSPLIKQSHYHLMSFQSVNLYEDGNVATIVSQNYVVNQLMSNICKILGNKAKEKLYQVNKVLSDKLI